jgi:hypothetical protein
MADSREAIWPKIWGLVLVLALIAWLAYFLEW